MSQKGILNIAGGGGSGTPIMTLTGNSGVVPPTANNVNIVGSGAVVVTGNPGTSTLTISISGGSFTWNDVTSATQLVTVNNGYVTDRGGGVTYTLPATAAFGDEFIITGKTGLWTLAQNANQQITIGALSTTVGVTGSLVATSVGDTLLLVCITAGASTVWRAISSIGNPTIN